MKKRCFYFGTLLGAVCLMLLRVFAGSGLLCALLVTVGLGALLFGLRQACSLKDFVFVACVLAVTYTVRFYGYTANPVLDIVLGPLVGLIMFAIMCTQFLFKRYKDRFWFTLIFPAAYLVFLYFTELVKIIMPFRLDVYYSCMPLLCQVSSVLGIYFIDFLLAWTASCLAYASDYFICRIRKDVEPVECDIAGKQLFYAVTLYATVLCFVLLFGFVHMRNMKGRELAKKNNVVVACATGPFIGRMGQGPFDQLSMDQVLDGLDVVVKDAASRNAGILVFSEEAFSCADTNEAVLLSQARSLAALYKMHIVLAYEVVDTDSSEGGKGINKLCWISDSGDVVYSYTKNCLVPFIEASEYVRGGSFVEPFTVEVQGSSLKVAAAICYDSDFDLYMNHMGKDVDLLVLPSWDWSVIAQEHFAVARMRAIQSRSTVVRSVYDGYSAVINPCGNILGNANANVVGYGLVLVTNVPVN